MAERHIPVGSNLSYVVNEATGGVTDLDVNGQRLNMARCSLGASGGATGIIAPSGKLAAALVEPLSGNTAAVFGDSRVVQSFTDTTMTGGTLAGVYEAKGWWNWFQFLAGHPFNLVQMAGKSGDTTTLALARQGNPQGGAMFGNCTNPGWTAHRPAWLFVTLGINDILNSVATATSVANARAILDAALARGTMVVWATEYAPGGDGTGLTAAQLALLNAWNTALKGLESVYPNLLVPDVRTAFADPANPGYSYSGLMNDGSGTWIHPNNVGGKLYADTVYAYIQSYLPLPSSLVLAGDANELISTNLYCNQYQINPLLAGANLGAAGVSVANGGGATSTAKLITDPSGFGQAIQIDANFSAATSAYVYVTLTDSKANLVGGERIIGACAITFGAQNGTDGVVGALAASNYARTVMHSIAVTDAVADGGGANFRNTRDASTSIAASNDSGLRSGGSGISVTPAYQLKAAAPQLAQQQFYIRGTANGGAFRVIISRPTIRRVKPVYVNVPVEG